jgi:cytochrome d ubiquinol oxidase subunit II
MLACYVVFDGFDLGAGTIHPFVARTEGERRASLAAIGPVWDGNEVWLLAAGGTLYFAFPRLYASSFSGFYLPLMIVLWLLILRGIAIEFRNHLEGPAWTPAWDVVLCGSSGLLAVFFGAALGNVVRGVPLDARGRFFLPLWVDLGLGGEPGILDVYTILVGATSLVALVLHGALWVRLKTEGDLRARAERVARGAFWAALGLTAAVTLATFAVQPSVGRNLARWPWGAVFPALALAGLVATRVFLGRGSELRPFLASSAYLVGMMASAAFGLYPHVLPAIGDPALGLSVDNAASSPYALGVGLVWFVPGMLLVVAYFAHTYRRFAGKVAGDGSHGA